MKRPQLITIGIAAVLVVVIFIFGRTIPKKVIPKPAAAHDVESLIDTILYAAKSRIKPDQAARLTALENTVGPAVDKEGQLKVFHQLAHFWGDTAGFYLPYAWYEAKAARLENSEKTLTFAAHLFLDYLQKEPDERYRKWEALQAKDLFERSLKINPDNDSAKVGLGACYLFGNISSSPMEGIAKIREVAEKDSTNVYAQMTLVKGSLMSGQFEKALTRLLTVVNLQPGNLEAILMLADVYERTGNTTEAIKWYRASLEFVKRPDAKAEIEKRIAQLQRK